MKYNKSIIRVSVIASVFSLASQCASAKCYYNDDKTAADCMIDPYIIVIRQKQNDSIDYICKDVCGKENLQFDHAEWTKTSNPPELPKAGWFCACMPKK